MSAPETPPIWTLCWTSVGPGEWGRLITATGHQSLKDNERREVIEKAPVDAERERMLDLLEDARRRLGPFRGNVTDGIRFEIDDLLREHGRLGDFDGD